MLGRIGSGVGLWRALRLIWPLLKDRRVPLVAKSVPILAILYILSPVDLVPDLFPGLGQVDDLSVMILSILLFLRMVPREVLREKIDILHHTGGGAGSGGKGPRGPTIEGDYEILE